MNMLMNAMVVRIPYGVFGKFHHGAGDLTRPIFSDRQGVSMDIDSAIERYCGYLAQRNCVRSTVEDYRAFLVRFSVYLAQDHPQEAADIARIEYQTLEVFLERVRYRQDVPDIELAPATRAKQVNRLRSFGKYVQRKNRRAVRGARKSIFGVGSSAHPPNHAARTGDRRSGAGVAPDQFSQTQHRQPSLQSRASVSSMDERA